MPTPATTPCLVGCTTSTTGTGDYILSAPTAPLPPPFSHPFYVLVDGQTITGTVSDNNAYEHGVYTYHSAGGAGGSLTRTTITSSSTAPNATRTQNPINWGAVGVRNFFSDVPETGFLLAGNNGSDAGNLQSFRLNLGLNTTTDSGVVAGAVPKLVTGAKLPSGVDVSLCTGFPASPAASVPSGAITDWFNSAAPSGWTRITTYDDCMISITNSTGTNGGGPFAAGTFVPGGWDASSGMSVGGHAISIAEMPAHSHTVGIGNFITDAGSTSFSAPSLGSAWGVIASTNTAGSGATHTHTLSSASTWRPPSIKMLLASKN